MIEELCNQIYKKDEFKNEYNKLSLLNYQLYFHMDNVSKIDNNLEGMIKRLLQCATVFSLSQTSEFRQLAYKIAVMSQNIINQINCSYIELSNIIPLIFTRLGNFPAENKYISENDFVVRTNLPTQLWFEQEGHRISNTVKIAKTHKLTLTDFQLKLWKSVNQYPVTIVNAPTSAGKSFILQNHLVNSICSICRNALYIVPTRALIDQVINDFRNIIKLLDVTDITISSIPEFDDSSKTIYVLTQERTQLLLENNITLDLVVVDEAQNVSDSARGIILQSVIEEINVKCPNAKFVFATPFVQNPQEFLNMFSLKNDKSSIIPVGESPVAQNLFSVTSKKDPYHFEISRLTEKNEFSSIGSLSTNLKIVNEKHYMALLALEVGKNKNNIIYGSEPSKCEEIACWISQQLPEESDNSELLDFSDYIKEHIHKDYLLAETIRHGVAYHYGNLPSFLRKGIERLCSTGNIKYIVCTSTLLQGVNLPAQNIFIMKPTKGKDAHKMSIPLSVPDFWNLAGRAGRLTKDFEGNVFLINLDEWDINPIIEKEKQSIVTSSFKQCVCNADLELCEYIENFNHKSGEVATQCAENAFMKLYLLSDEGKLENTLDGFGSELELKQKNRLIAAIENAKKIITLPREVYLKNPNVSIYRQQALYDYLIKCDDSRIRSIIPPHPLQPFNNIKNTYKELFHIFDKLIANEQKDSYKYFYWISLYWMRGTPYSDLLKNQIDYKNNIRKKGTTKVNTEARKLFTDIEFFLRFKYVKFSKCYTDILIQVLHEKKLDDLINSVSSIHLYLELGASSETMINLIGIGLSRTAAWILSRKIINVSMTRNELIQWLANTNLNSLDLPHSVIAEISQIL